MKINELLKMLGQRAGLSPEQVDSAIESGQFDENDVQALTNGLLNREAAISDPDLRNQILGKTLGGIDETIINHVAERYANALPEGFITELKGKGKTSEKVITALDTLAESYNSKLAQYQEKDGAAEALKKELEQAAQTMAKMRAEKEEALKQVEEVKRNFHNQQVRTVLQGIVSQRKFSGANDEINRVLQKTVIDNVMSKADFQISEDGNLIPFVKGTDQKLLNPETQQPDIKHVLDPVLSPFLAKSNPPKDEQETAPRRIIQAPNEGDNLTPKQRERLNALAAKIPKT